MTVILLKTMAKLAIMGVMEIPMGFNTPMAMGIIRAL